MGVKKTIAGWVKYLNGISVFDEAVDQKDFDSRCLMDIRDNVIRLNDGIVHMESMQVAQEDSQTQVMAQMGIAPISGEERERRIQLFKEYRRKLLGIKEEPIQDLTALPPRKDSTEF